MEQNRFKSKVLWAAIIAQFLAILAFAGFFEAVGIAQELVSNIVGGVLQLLVLFGVLNNPTSADKF